MSDRSTLVDLNTQGGLTYVNKGFKKPLDKSVKPSGIDKTWKEYGKYSVIKDNDGI